MMERDNFRQAAGRVLETDDVEQILKRGFFAGVAEPPKSEPPEIRPDHYKVICISLYNEDLKQLDTMVASLKRRGLTKASRSALIRYALSQVDLDAVPRGL
jgi:hypothetical protein